MPEEVGCCTKYFLFSFNVLFWLFGLALLGVGIWAWSEKGFFDNLSVISSLPIDPVVVIIIIAILMFLLSFAGCLGSLRENICLLKCFSICLGVIFFSELIAGILGFVYKDWFHDQFAVFINKTIKDYRTDPDLQNIIDFSQDYLECCGGALGPNDWDNNIYFNCNMTITVNGIPYTPQEACGVPFSCCRTDSPVVNTQCGFGVRSEETTPAEKSDKIFTIGCISSFEDWLKTHLYTVAGIFIGVALMQIIPICFAQNLINDIQAIKARWMQEKWSKLQTGLLSDPNVVKEKASQLAKSSLRKIAPAVAEEIARSSQGSMVSGGSQGSASTNGSAPIMPVMTPSAAAAFALQFNDEDAYVCAYPMPRCNSMPDCLDRIDVLRTTGLN